MKNYHMIFLFIAVISCNTKDKIIEQQQKSLLMTAITNGQWKVSNFVMGGNNITSEFVTYKFQFKENYTVDAINNGTIEKTGTWMAAGDIQAQTITANFTNGLRPVNLLNGTWNIINTTWTSVQASMVMNNETYRLQLDKL